MFLNLISLKPPNFSKNRSSIAFEPDPVIFPLSYFTLTFVEIFDYKLKKVIKHFNNCSRYETLHENLEK